MISSPEKFHVLIAGGGIAGLALARSLELAGISFTLLEGRSEFAPLVGSCLAISASGGRVLDQLGGFNDAQFDSLIPLKITNHRTSQGELIMPPTDMTELWRARTGLDIYCMERSSLMGVLHRTIGNKSRLLVNKRIQRVDMSEEGVSVTCQDNSVHHGHVLIGCDGTRSFIRQEMWRLADERVPGFIPPSDKTAMTAEYKAMFAVSTAVPDMPANGTMDIGYGIDRSNLVFVNGDNRIYWLIFAKLDRVYKGHEIPRYNKEDAQRFAQEMADWKTSPTTTVKMLFENATVYRLVALEEAQYEKWTYGRIACCGDSVHRMTPNAGTGGGASIESAAAIANALHSLVNSHKGLPPAEAVLAALHLYQTTRQPRAKAVCEGANNLTRMHAMKKPIHRAIVRYLLPISGDKGANMTNDRMVGGVMLDFLPPPAKSLRGHMPFNPNAGVGKTESVLKRLLLATPPLLALTFAATRVIDPTAFLPELTAIAKTRLFRDARITFAVREAFTGWVAFDRIWRGATIRYLPSISGVDQVSRAQMWSFLTDLGVVYSVLLIEKARRANGLTIFKLLAVMMTAAQLVIGAKVLPLFFLLAWPTSQVDHYKTRDMRLTSMAYTSTVLASMTLCYYIPHFGQFFAPSLESRHLWNWAWQIFPITVSLVQRFLAYTVAPDTIRADRIRNPLRDLPAIALQVAPVAVLSAYVWITTYTTSVYNMHIIFVPPAITLSTTDFITTIRELLQWDWVFIFAACFTWLAYSFWDLKAAGMVCERWAALLLGAAACVAMFGPGAAFALAWGYREYCLAYRWHKDAVVSANVETEYKKKV